MDRRKLLGAALLTLPLVAGGIVLAASNQPTSDKQTQQTREEGYTCPATGEELPCPFCCPLNKGK
jgi:hypothetical protein